MNMVKFKCMTKEEKAKKERIEKIKGLVREVFGDEKSILNEVGFDLYVRYIDEKEPIVKINTFSDKIELRNPKYTPQAYDFGKKYEERGFLLDKEKEFLIETDYS